MAKSASGSIHCINPAGVNTKCNWELSQTRYRPTTTNERGAENSTEQECCTYVKISEILVEVERVTDDKLIRYFKPDDCKTQINVVKQ